MQKRCSSCRQEFPATTEFFPANRAQRCGLDAKCRPCRREYRSRLYAENIDGERDKRIAAAKRSYRANLEKCRARQRQRNREESQRDPAAWRAKKRAEMSSSRAGFEALLGYGVETLRIHLEKQFTEELGWHNYGAAWEIDHIIPMRLFAVKAAGDAEFKAAWALSNLRPLPKSENRSKGGKRLLLI